MAASIAAASRGDAAQAAFDRKLSHCRNEIGELQQQFTSDLLFGRRTGDHTQLSLERFSMRQTLPPVGTGSKCLRNHFIAVRSTKSTSLTAAMARAVLPNPSARGEWLFAGIIDRVLHHWGHVPALDGGRGDHDLADSEIDTAIPDDDIVSLASYAHESVWPSSF